MGFPPEIQLSIIPTPGQRGSHFRISRRALPERYVEPGPSKESVWDSMIRYHKRLRAPLTLRCCIPTQWLDDPSRVESDLVGTSRRSSTEPGGVASPLYCYSPHASFTRSSSSPSPRLLEKEEVGPRSTLNWTSPGASLHRGSGVPARVTASLPSPGVRIVIRRDPTMHPDLPRLFFPPPLFPRSTVVR